MEATIKEQKETTIKEKKESENGKSYFKLFNVRGGRF